jgi:hypothetical protein
MIRSFAFAEGRKTSGAVYLLPDAVAPPIGCEVEFCILECDGFDRNPKTK